jgi:hypothetical protein
MVSVSPQDIDARDAEDNGGLAEESIVADRDLVFPRAADAGADAADVDTDTDADAALPAAGESTWPDGRAEDERGLTTTYPVTIRLEEAFTVGPDGIAVRPEGHLVVAVNPGGAPPQGGVAIESLPVGVTLDALVGVAVAAVLRGIPHQLAQAELNATAIAKLAPRTVATPSTRSPTTAGATTGAKRPSTAPSPPTPQTPVPPRGAATGPSMMERAVALEKERGGGETVTHPARADGAPSAPATDTTPLAPDGPGYTQASLFDVGV